MIDIPEDLRHAPYEIQRDFIEAFNRALAEEEKDPMQKARQVLIEKYGTGKQEKEEQKE